MNLTQQQLKLYYLIELASSAVTNMHNSSPQELFLFCSNIKDHLRQAKNLNNDNLINYAAISKMLPVLIITIVTLYVEFKGSVEKEETQKERDKTLLKNFMESFAHLVGELTPILELKKQRDGELSGLFIDLFTDLKVAADLTTEFNLIEILKDDF